MREYYVYVYSYERENSAAPMVIAYLTHRTALACVHKISAKNGDESKQLAIKEHRRECLPIAERVVTHPNGHLNGKTCTCPQTILPVREVE